MQKIDNLALAISNETYLVKLENKLLIFHIKKKI